MSDISSDDVRLRDRQLRIYREIHFRMQPVAWLARIGPKTAADRGARRTAVPTLETLISIECLLLIEVEFVRNDHRAAAHQVADGRFDGRAIGNILADQ